MVPHFLVLPRHMTSCCSKRFQLLTRRSSHTPGPSAQCPACITLQLATQECHLATCIYETWEYLSIGDNVGVRLCSSLRFDTQ